MHSWKMNEGHRWMSQARTGMSGIGVACVVALLAALLLMPGSIYAQSQDSEPVDASTRCPLTAYGLDTADLHASGEVLYLGMAQQNVDTPEGCAADDAQIRAVADPSEPSTLAPPTPMLFMPTLSTD